MAFPGESLKVLREENDLSREDVYRKLRIPADFVAKLEDGNLNGVPSTTYAVGFLKTYCAFLEVDHRPYVEALLAETQPIRGFLATAADAETRPAWLSDAIVWASICALLAFGWLSYAVVFEPEAEEGRGQVQADSLDLRVPNSLGGR